jgi:hypothetical protein
MPINFISKEVVEVIPEEGMIPYYDYFNRHPLFFVKLKDSKITALEEDISYCLRVGSAFTEKVGLLHFILCIPRIEFLAECFLNYYATPIAFFSRSFERPFLNYLKGTKGGYLIVFLNQNSKPIKTILCKLTSEDMVLIQDFCDKCATLEPWTVKEFDNLKASVQRKKS